jgi:hypothetical protein
VIFVRRGRFRRGYPAPVWQVAEEARPVIPGAPKARARNPQMQENALVSGFRARRFAASRNDGAEFSAAC